MPSQTAIKRYELLLCGAHQGFYEQKPRDPREPLDKRKLGLELKTR